MKQMNNSLGQPERFENYLLAKLVEKSTHVEDVALKIEEGGQESTQDPSYK